MVCKLLLKFLDRLQRFVRQLNFWPLASYIPCFVSTSLRLLRRLPIINISIIGHQCWRTLYTLTILSFKHIFKLVVWGHDAKKWYPFVKSSIHFSLTFFQMGTIAFRVSIQYCTASNDSFLCADEIAIITLASPTGTTLERQITNSVIRITV